MVPLIDDFDDFAAYALAYGAFSHDTIPGAQLRIADPIAEYGPAPERVTVFLPPGDEGDWELPAA